jgi:seryl-tRNA synthetase
MSDKTKLKKISKKELSSLDKLKGSKSRYIKINDELEEINKKINVIIQWLSLPWYKRLIYKGGLNNFYNQNYKSKLVLMSIKRYEEGLKNFRSF